MTDQKLEQTIIQLARQQHSRAEIIRVLISEGYDAALIEETINFLYYSGKLSSDVNAIIERENIHTIDAAIEDKSLPEDSSHASHLWVWIRIHKVAALCGLTLVLIIGASIFGGLWGYHTAPTVILDKALNQFENKKVISYTASGTIQLEEQDRVTFSSEGIIDVSSIPQAVTSVSFQRNEDAPWSIDIMHTNKDTVFVRLQKSPIPYPFVYNTWIQVGTTPEDTDALAQLGLGDIVSHVSVLKPFSLDSGLMFHKFASNPGAYSSISTVNPTNTCASPYAVAFNENRIADILSAVSGADIKVLSFLTRFPWHVCINSGEISGVDIDVPTGTGGVEGSIYIIFRTPHTYPSFTIDSTPVPLVKMAEWIREGKQK